MSSCPSVQLPLVSAEVLVAILAPRVAFPAIDGSLLSGSFNILESGSLGHVHEAARMKGTDLAVTGPSASTRGGKKRRRTNKELEMFDRHVKLVERRQKFTNQWIPISCEQNSHPATILPSDTTCFYSPSFDPVIQVINNTTPTPVVPTASLSSSGDTSQRPSRPKIVCAGALHRITPIHMRENPLPNFPWADSSDVWQIMLAKEELPVYARDPRLFSRHPALTPRMRTILIDWLMEVCEAFKLKRDTFHMCVDVIDRYLSNSSNLPKAKLQLTGVAALFIASKVEESQPLKAAEVSYVTDKNCSEKDVLQQELLILKALNWSLSPLTVISWVTTFLQTISADCQESKELFMIPQYSQHPFIQIMRLLDLCLLDVGSLQFSYSILSASALYYMSVRDRALSVSGYQWTDIAECVEWMSTFAATLKNVGPIDLKFFTRVSPNETHNIQTHVVNVPLLDSCRRKSCIPENRHFEFNAHCTLMPNIGSRILCPQSVIS